MKRTLAAVAAAALLTFSAACGDEADDPNDEETTSAEETAEATPTLEQTVPPGEGRPPVEELAEAFRDPSNPAVATSGGAINEETADCFAELFHSSDLSDESIRALVAGDDQFQGMEGDDEALESITPEDAAECLQGTQMQPTP